MPTDRIRSTSSTPSTARDPSGGEVRFRVTHPFHPLHGREFVLVDRRRTWGEDRVYYVDASGNLKRLLAAWTSIVDDDAFVVVSAGRAHFRTSDLIELASLVEDVRCRSGARRGRGKVSIQ